jgi:ABC-2 type transport system ATP-binding protein
MIDVQHISKTYPKANTKALNDISFRIKKGDIFGLLGPNGAGKSSMMNILCGLLKPSSGAIKVDGHDIISDIKAIKQMVGVVPQDIALYPTLTAYENLIYFGSLYKINKKTLRSLIENHLAIFGLIDAANRPVQTYSGGMKRRVNLIAGILHQPQIVILDEPTVGIDVQSRKVIVDFIKQLNTEQGTTVIYTSHHLEEAQSLCNQVAIIDSGKIIIEGTPQQLITANTGCNSLEDVFIHLTGKNLRD